MKEYPNKMDLDQIWNFFAGFPLIHFATIDENQPRVRSMSLISYNDQLWLASKSSWAKVSQIKRNGRMEFILAMKGEKGVGTLRVTGTAELVNEYGIKRELSSVIPWFESYWDSPGDPEFALIRLHLKLIRYDNPDNGKKYRVEVGQGNKE